MSNDENAGSPAPWQWPGLWSLNQPALVVLWLLLFAQTFHVWLGLYHYATAAALAWMFVATERWLFFFRLRANAEEETAALSEQRAAMIRICLLLIVGLVLVAGLRASPRETGGILIWSSLGGGYLLALRLYPATMSEILPREMALAIYLAGTVVLFVWAGAVFAPNEVLLPGFLLVLLLFYYFSLLVTWSRPWVPAPITGALFDGPLGIGFRTIPVVLIAAGVLLAVSMPLVAGDTLLMTIGVSVLILVMLDIWKKFLSAAAARIFADVAMLTPMLPLLASL